MTQKPQEIAQVSALVDDDSKPAKDLTELDKIYRMSDTQMGINIERELETMSFDMDKECTKHVEKLYHLVSKLATYDKPVTHGEKVLRFLRTLPPRFAAITMVAKANIVPFEKIIASVIAKISRKKFQGNSKSTPSIATAVSKANFQQGGRDSSRTMKQNIDLCCVCGKLGHYVNKCWHGNTQLAGGKARGRGRGTRFSRGEKGRRISQVISFNDTARSQASQGQPYQEWGF